jgi:hypothetical protein
MERCATPCFAGPFRLGRGFAPGAEVFWYCVVFGDDRSGLVDGDRCAVNIAELVGLPSSPAGDDPGQERGGDVAERGVVVLACLGQEAVVFGGQGGVDAAGLAGGREQRFAQNGVAAFGRASVSAGQAGRVEDGHQAGEGSGAGEGGEPVWVAEPAQDGGGGDRGDAGCRGEDCSAAAGKVLITLWPVMQP